MKNAISHSVVSDILRVGSSSPAVIRGGLAVLMVAIILDQHRCRAVSHSGVSQASVVSSLPVDDHDHGSYVAPTPGRLPTIKSVSTTYKSKSHIVETPQPLPTANGVLTPKTFVFNSPCTQGKLPHLSIPTGPTPQPSGSQHASPWGTSLGTKHPDREDN